MDAQGPNKALPYIQNAKTTYTNVIDEDNLLGQILGFKAIPNGLLIDENGILKYMQFGGFDIQKSGTAEIVAEWVKPASFTGGTPLPAKIPEDDKHFEAIALFQQGTHAFRQGDTAAALGKWRNAMALAPDNLVIRKQIWAVENPDKFYSGTDVDYNWQREQFEKGL
jgi:hypothetical protein